MMTITINGKGDTFFTIQRYIEDDIPEMLQSIEAFLNQDRFLGFENHYKGIDFDRDKVYTLLKSKKDDPLFFTNIVKDQRGKIVGGLAGQVVPYVFSKETVAQDWLFYFDPSFSNLTVLFALIQSYIDWANVMNVREVQLFSSTGFKQERFGKLMEYVQFKPFAQGYSRRFR